MIPIPTTHEKPYDYTSAHGRAAMDTAALPDVQRNQYYKTIEFFLPLVCATGLVLEEIRFIRQERKSIKIELDKGKKTAATMPFGKLKALYHTLKYEYRFKI